MQFDTSYLTAAGREIATTDLGGLDQIQYTKAVASSDDYSSLAADDLRKLTDLDGVEQTVNYSKILKKDTTTLTLRVDFPSEDVKTAYELYTVGFYAKLKSGDEVLYAVLPSDTPDKISAYDGKSNVNDSFTINTTVSNTSDVDFSLTAAGTLTESDLDTIFASRHIATTEDIDGKLKDYYTKSEIDNKFVTDDDFSSKLPKNIATTDAANTFAKSQTLAGGATDGKGNAYATTKDVATGLNNGLSTKVTDNKDGTEQLNGVKVQPFNKLSDTIGGRNLLLGTSPVKVRNPTWQNFIKVDVTNLVGTTLTYSAMIDNTDSTQGSVGVLLAPKDSSDKSIGNGIWSNWINWGTAGKAIVTITIPAGASNLIIDEQTNNTDQNPFVGSRKLEQGSIATDWTPAPEDKADDSKVVHNSGLATMPTDNSGLVVGNNRDIGLVKQSGSNGAVGVGSSNLFSVVQSNNRFMGIADTFHDMFKVNGNYQISLGPGAFFTPADDSKVVHNTGNEEIAGTKTFDTAPIDKTTGNPYITKDGVPAVPSTLADTTKPANFTAGLQSGGVDVATAADLKSIEDSAWRPIISNNYSGLCMMKYNADTDTMSLSGTIFPQKYSTEGSRVAVIIPLPDGFSMGTNTDSKTTIWTNVNTIVQKFSGTVADLKYESDGIHIIFDKIYSNYQDPKMFIILDDFFAYSTANPQSNNLINFKVTKN